MYSLLPALVISLLLIAQGFTQVAERASAVSCYCDSGSHCDLETNTCQLSTNGTSTTDGVVYSSCYVDYSLNSGGQLRHLCLQFGLHCKSTSRVLRGCCDDESQCNKCLLPDAQSLSYEHCVTLSGQFPLDCPPINCTEYKAPEVTNELTPVAVTDSSMEGAGMELTGDIVVIICVLAVVVLLTSVVLVTVVCCVASKRRRTQQIDATGKCIISQFEGSFSEAGRGGVSSGGLTTGRGALLCERTIANEIKREECIATGGFGEVWIGNLHGHRVAVKICKDNRDMAAYKREQMICAMLSHPNTVRYMAADIENYCNEGIIKLELWLVMQYYPLGCLADHLAENTLQPDQAMRILCSVTSALHYLHHPYKTTTGYTHPVIAHRDLKTRNILLEKESGVCVIADFGLALIEEDFSKDAPPVKVLVGTKRYMAPEILSEDINVLGEICSFCKADIYSFGLIMWEVLLRTEIEGSAGEYRNPYHNLISNNPTIEEVRKVVVGQRRRPELDNRWRNNEKVTDLMKECWSSSPDGRPTATRLNRTLFDLLPSMKITY